MKKLRIGIAFFYHESHSFAPIKTDIQAFYNEGYFKGAEIFSAYTATKTEVGGFLDVLSKVEQIEIVPLLCAAATPSGPVTDEAYQQIEGEMLTEIEKAGKLDGLLLALHGAMVVEGIFDPEEKLLKEIRNLIGHDIPIATTLDMHANLSATMLNHTPYHFGFKTYPHVDMYDQGVNAATLLLEHLLEKKRYAASFIKLPMMPPSINMRTEEGPMHELMVLASKLESYDFIKNASVFGGFPYSDIPIVGASVLVIANDQNNADHAARELANKFWEIRDDFIMELPTVKEGMKIALSMEVVKPIVLADISDNPLSCGSGDTTLLLEEFIYENNPKTLFGGLTDPESIERCRNAGVGSTVMLELGGKTSPEFGGSVKVKAEVMALSDGVFYNSGPFNQHLRVDVKGAAYIRAGNVDILLIGRPMSANDPEMFRHIGIEPTSYTILGLKVKNHFRAAFDPIISKVIYVDAPGVASNGLSHFPYKNIPEDIWPLKDIEFTEVEEV
ncbi:M81 family metallopeptidase [Neobacillus sp. PS3-34]|uniref:M81 family metallopeptidase n=1 Tax=Neobacillus sp. PS3-34 TaxID=3070678 RepID=UPI0027DF8525|nr:M81 family metallopeptidase [Neobacillus sp. PS3-34]WML48434.1 M81 family metallopeptidase [Neobacillus sp. PS3-34]